MLSPPSDYAELEERCYAAAIVRLDTLLTASGNPANVSRLNPPSLRAAIYSVLPSYDDLSVQWFCDLLSSNPRIFEGGNDRGEDLKHSALIAIESTIWEGIKGRLEDELERRAALLEEAAGMKL